MQLYNKKLPGLTAVGMSGGVDSAAAALLLAESGNDIIGVTLRLVDESVSKVRSRQEEKNVEDAAEVCRKIGIPHFVVDARSAFLEKVIQPFCREYMHGRTPNPCIVCNMKVKIREILMSREIPVVERVATGHYAAVVHPGDPEYPGFGDGRALIRTASHLAKDQSYMLWGLYPDLVDKLETPLSRVSKAQVRELAASAGLFPRNTIESQDICFVPSGNFFFFIREMFPEAARKGEFVDSKGNVLGVHNGIAAYTIGQRRGLDVSYTDRLYVTSIDPGTNRIVLGKKKELFSSHFTVTETQWGANLDGVQTGRVKIRYNQKGSRARWWRMPEETDRIVVELENPQRAIAPGQSAVFYKGRFMVGGGIIEGPL